MDQKRIVITGVGIISSNGIGREAFSQAIFAGVSGIKPISLFDTSEFSVKTAGEIKDFNPQEFLGPKGLRFSDRSTNLASSAIKLALQDANLEISQNNTKDTGVVLGCTLGSLKSICDFDKDALTVGPKFVPPALFPNTVINSPASQISIRFNVQGFNTTVANGFTAGLDAIIYAYNFLKIGRGKVVLAGGVEELCIQTFLGFYRTKCLAGLGKKSVELSCPFDKRRNGFIFGEGAGILALEDLENARKRGARILAEVIASGSSFEPCGIGKFDVAGKGLARSIKIALQKSGITNIDYVCSGANSSVKGDILETAALKQAFGDRVWKLNISSIKSMTGECHSASGALQAAAAVCAIKNNLIPPTISYQEKDQFCDLNYVANTAKKCKIDNVLVNAFGPNGHNSSLVISRFNQ